MIKTKLPTRNDYQNAVNELKKLNEELFYDDFKTKIKDLESNLEQLAYSNALDFKKESENVVSRAGSLFRQIETQKEDMQALLENNQNVIFLKTQEFLEHERTHLLIVYEEMQKSMNQYTEQMAKLQQDNEFNNRQIIEQAVGVIESVSHNVKEFAHKLSVFNEENREYLEGSKAYFALTKEQLIETEQKLTDNARTLQLMDERWEQLLKSSEEKYLKHEDSLKEILVVRDETLVNKVTELHNGWAKKYFVKEESNKLEIVQSQEKYTSLLTRHIKQSEDMLKSVSTNMVTKEDLVSIEKKSVIKTKILITVVVLEAILIGLQLFL